MIWQNLKPMFQTAFKERWWDEVKDREVVHWNIIGGGIYKVELFIELGKERKHG